MRSLASIVLCFVLVQSGTTLAAEKYSMAKLDSFSLEYPTSLSVPPGANQYHFTAGTPYKKLPASFMLDASVWLARQKFSSEDDFISFYKDILERRTSFDTRNQVREFEFAKQNIGVMVCAKYEILMLDKESKYSSLGVNVVRAVGIGCLHPHKNSKLIEASYSVRNSDGEISSFYKEIGERFLKSTSYE